MKHKSFSSIWANGSSNVIISCFTHLRQNLIIRNTFSLYCPFDTLMNFNIFLLYLLQSRMEVKILLQVKAHLMKSRVHYRVDLRTRQVTTAVTIIT